ncbi:hypothetical protein D3C76_1339200 [compost metagenome]
MNTQRIKLSKALRLSSKHGGDPRSTDDEFGHQHEAFKGHCHSPLNAQLMQVRGIHRQVSAIGKLANHVLRTAIVGQAQAFGEPGLPSADDATELIVHQR